MRAFKAVNEYAGVVQWLESQPSKLVVWVRFPSPAPTRRKGTIALGGIKRYAPIAQLDRVSGYEPEGRGFESLLACQFTLVTLLGILQ